MSAESWIALIGALGVLIYLVYTLLRPEKF
jgi:K+-transporting ATPase KdpF subunit